jgi:hypothetical protein
MVLEKKNSPELDICADALPRNVHFPRCCGLASCIGHIRAGVCANVRCQTDERVEARSYRASGPGALRQERDARFYRAKCAGLYGARVP